MARNLGSCQASPRSAPPPGAADRPGSRSTGTVICPRASPQPTRHTPRRSPSAVATMSTRESASSIQSTGTSWIRSPARSASTSSSVSKNHDVSATRGSSSRAASARIALNPHCASENPTPSVVRSSRLYPREMTSRFAPRTTRDPRASRVPMATSLWPDSSGATRGSSAFRSVDRSTSMYASTSASLADQIACSARPRPGRSRCTARTSPGSAAASDCATAQVPSVLPLSAIVTRAVHGKADRRYPTSRRTLGARSRSSFRTGITISTCGETSLMPVSVKPLDERPLRRGSEIALSQLRLCASYPAAEPSVQNHPERTRFSAPPASAR